MTQHEHEPRERSSIAWLFIASSVCTLGAWTWVGLDHTSVAFAVALTIGLGGALAYARIKELLASQTHAMMSAVELKLEEDVTRIESSVEDVARRVDSIQPSVPLAAFLDQLQRRAVEKAKRDNVEELLHVVARGYLKATEMNEGQIIALCSHKGRAGPPYYDEQLKWCEGGRKRILRRVFVRRSGKLSPDDEAGVLQHWDRGAENDDNVQIRFVNSDHDVLSQMQSDHGWVWFSHGRAIVHNRKRGGEILKANPGAPLELDILQRVLEYLFDQASCFDEKMIGEIRQSVEERKRKATSRAKGDAK